MISNGICAAYNIYSYMHMVFILKDLTALRTIASLLPPAVSDCNKIIEYSPFIPEDT